MKENMSPRPHLLRIPEVAAILGVGKDWVYRRIRSGELAVVELGSTRKNQRISEKELNDYIERHTHPAHGV